MIMFNLNQETINEIAGQLEIGNNCFINKETKEIKFTPDFDANPYYDEETWKEELQFLEMVDEDDDWIKIESMTSHHSFRMMEEFIDTVDNMHLKSGLIKALEGKNPFRNFKISIDDSGAYREQWFRFKEEGLRRWVEEQLED